MTDGRKLGEGFHAAYVAFGDRELTPTEVDEFNAFRLNASFVFHATGVVEQDKPMSIAERLEAGKFLRSVAGVDFDRVTVAAQRAKQEARGLLLTGAAGCGKTLAVRALYPKAKHYNLCNPDCLRWLKNDTDVLLTGISVVLDDMGAEHEKNDYGVKANTVGDWIELAYEAKKMSRWGGVMHITTNLTAEEFAGRYGVRVISRITEMVVSVRMEGKTHRQKISV